MRVKLSAKELSERIKMSIRHCHRLIARDDDRAYVEVSDHHGHSTPPPASTRDALENVRRILKECERPMASIFCMDYKPDDYTGYPDNWPDVLMALKAISRAIMDMENVAGFYHENNHHGEVTVYELAVSGGRIHRSYRDRVLAWARKHGQKLNVTFHGYPDGEVLFDDDDNEIPAPPDEQIVGDPPAE